MSRSTLHALPGLIAALVTFGLVVAGGDATAASAAAAKARHKAPKPAPTIVWRGDHCTARIFRDMVKRYAAAHLGKVILQPFSTVSGLDAVNAGTVDIAGTARAAMPGRSEEQGTNFYPVAWDALVPIVSIHNPVSDISLKQLHDLYLGHIKNWKELGGVDAPINLYAVAAPLDGVEYSTRLLLFHYGDQTVSAPRLYINTEQLEAGVVIDPHGIGMSTLSGVAGNKKLKMLSVEGVTATDTSITDGTYPLYSALYLAARSDDPNQDAIARFIAFTSSDAGKAVLRRHNLVPFADAPGLQDMNQQRVAFINAHVHPPVAAVTPAVTAPGETPVSAPIATAQALERLGPTSELTAKAKARAARARAARARAARAAKHGKKHKQSGQDESDAQSGHDH